MTPANLDEILENAWKIISVRYDIGSSLPDKETLFYDVDWSLPSAASEKLLSNMITETMECMGRFSPWYTQPAQAFGLVREQHTMGHLRLSVEALQFYQPLLETIRIAIESRDV